MNKLLLITSLIFSFSLLAETTVIYGNIPGRYLNKEDLAPKKNYRLGYIKIVDRVITEIEPIKSSSAYTKSKAAFEKSGATVIVAKYSSPNKYSASSFDFLYPGLIDLHNHTKQNNIDVWGLAEGQFENRFEWRGWSKYKYSVSGNMNPWIGYGKPMNCAAFRWSEMQAMVLGTTYLQGPSGCVSDFSVHRVEDKASYISNKDKVQAPTDLVLPGDMTFVWDELRPGIEKGSTYEKELAKYINKHCDIAGVSASTVNTTALKKLSTKSTLMENCDLKKVHRKFVRYTYWVHKTIAGRKKYLAKPNSAAVIAHLAEGRRKDAYNMVEYELVKLLGLDQKHVNFVHGVGIEKKNFPDMAKKGMGLIWSPYSNLLLYGETLDIYSARKAGVVMSLGSDWLPTGTRGILEEIKLAAKYIDKDPYGDGLPKLFNDEDLFLMLTENPAKLINHFDIDIKKKEHGVGQLKVGAMGTVIALRKYVEDPYTNIVRKAFSKDLNAVVIDGKFIYGSETYAKRLGFKSNQYERFPAYYKSLNKMAGAGEVPVLAEKGSNKSSKYNHMVEIGKIMAAKNPAVTDNCDFRGKKAFIHQDSLSNSSNSGLSQFKEETGLNLDRFLDVQKVLAVGLLTQSRNWNDTSKGKKDFAMDTFPPLFSCHTESYTNRLANFIIAKEPDDEYSINRAEETRAKRRKEAKLGATPKKMAKDYSRNK